MSKAINWPEQFKSVLLRDETGATRMAIRPKTIYFENRYWTAGDVVDLRANGEEIRQAKIVQDMKSCMVQDLTLDDLECFLPDIITIDGVVAYLKATYPELDSELAFSPETKISVVYYENLPLPVGV